MSYTFAGQFGPEAILSAGGTLQPSRSVTVYKSDGVTVATLYTDRTKGTTTANPTTSDVRGNLAVYADPGNYVLDYGGGSLFKILIPVDPAELSAAYEAGGTAVVYVDPAGSDSNPGLTRSKPKATLAAAIAALPAAGGVVKVAPFATLTHGAGDSFAIDVSKVRIRGHQSILHWTAAPTANYAVKLFSTVTYSTGYKNWGAALSGVTIQGVLNTPLMAVGLLVGDATNTINGDFHCENGGCEGWDSNIQFISNAYRAHFHNWPLRGGGSNTIFAGSGLTNMGENITFTDSCIEGPKVNVSTGEYHFIGCEIDNCNLAPDTSAAKIYVHGGHLENPNAGAAARYAAPTNNALVCIIGAEIVINDPQSASFGMAPFISAASNTWGGVVIRDCLLPPLGAGWFTPETTDGSRVFVAGTGRASLSGNTFIDSASGQGYSGGLGANQAYNGDVETGNLNGWTAYGSNTAGVTAQNVTKHAGTYAVEINPNAGNNAGAKQRIPIRPGQVAAFSAWWNLATLGASSSAQITLTWVANDGTTELGNALYAPQSTAGGGWKVIAGTGSAPAGAGYVEAQFFAANSGGGGVTLYVDDLILTAI